MSDPEIYKLFAMFISKNQGADCGAAISFVMRASGGAAIPDKITDWWNQWQIMRKAILPWGMEKP